MDTVVIEINRYYGKKSETIHKELSSTEAEQLKEILIQLNEAIENNDEATISSCQAILNEKGIFGDNHQKFFSNDKYSKTMEKTNLAKYTKYFGSNNGDNISNYMCYFNAIGEGLMLWSFGISFWEAIVNAIQNVSNPIAAFILFLALLPFLVLVMLFTNLVPFRIMAPTGLLAVANGSISSLGLGGFKRLKVGADSVGVNLSWFTGITINIPPINDRKSFLFVSGIAAEVEEE